MTPCTQTALSIPSCPDLPIHESTVVRRVNMPSAPAFETAAASWGTATIGVWTIGC